MRVYLDICCYNRPFDDQSNLLVMLEAEAKLFIQKEIKDGKIDLVWSFVLDYENSKNPYNDRKERINLWRSLAKEDCILTDFISKKAKDLMNFGLKQVDASHIACAIFKQADYFITTDYKVLKKNIAEIKVVNPITFLQEYKNEN